MSAPATSAPSEHQVDPDAPVPVIDGVPLQPRPAARRPGLIPTAVADALSAVLGKATAAMREHESGSRHGADMESVHQMRVATRRIRAYLKAARPALDAEAAAGLRADLSELAGALGVVRDLDVMIDRMHSEAARLGEPDTAALEHMVSRLDKDRARARKALVSSLDHAGHQSLLAELDEAARRPPVADPWADLRELAAGEYRVLAKAQQRIERKFDGNPPDDDLHELRIHGKRARYAAELLAGGRGAVKGRERKPDKDIAAFLAALAEFQEVLGNHQDASVLEDELRKLVAAGGDPAAALAAGRVIQGCRDRKVLARRLYPGAWAAVAAAADNAYDGT